MRIRSEEDAIAAYVASLSGGIPEGYSVAVSLAMDLSFILEDGTCLWHVGLVPDDEADSITPGTSTIMGPDGKVWRFPYNPNFYDREIVERALTHLYIENVADLVDPDSLCEQVKLITRQRDEAIFALPDAARRGELREVPERH